MSARNWRQTAARQAITILYERGDINWVNYHAELKAIPPMLRRNGPVLGLTLLKSRATSSDTDRFTELGYVLEDLKALSNSLASDNTTNANSFSDWIESLAATAETSVFMRQSRNIYQAAQLLKQFSGLRAIRQGDATPAGAPEETTP